MVKIWCTFTKAIEKISQGCHLFWTTLQSYTYNGRPIDSCIYIYIYMIYRTCQFQWPWTTPTPGFKVTPFFNAEYLRNGTRYRQFQWNSNKDLHTPYNDTKRRAVSLRQLSFLFPIPCQTLWQYSDGDPNRSVGCRSGMNKLWLSTNISL